MQDGISTISREREVMDVKNAKALEVGQGEIRFDRIRFHYGKEAGVIEDLSLTIHPGEKIGLIGRSGAGKSTLVNLILRFYDLEGGRILIDGQDIANVRQDDIRAEVGVVTQDTSLLHRSIFDNVAYGRPDATREEVLAALEKAHALSFVDELEDMEGRKGLDAHVGERGVKLSGGQRQRVAIARTLLKDAPILALDEATSALDSEVELAIQESLFDLMQGKTVIAIAHRLSTIAAMDRLIVMDKGRIIERVPSGASGAGRTLRTALGAPVGGLSVLGSGRLNPKTNGKSGIQSDSALALIPQKRAEKRRGGCFACDICVSRRLLNWTSVSKGAKRQAAWPVRNSPYPAPDEPGMVPFPSWAKKGSRT